MLLVDYLASQSGASTDIGGNKYPPNNADAITPVSSGFAVQFMEDGDSGWRHVMDTHRRSHPDGRQYDYTVTEPRKYPNEYQARNEAAYLMSSTTPKWARVRAVRIVPYVSG